MIIVCDSCSTSLQLDETKIPSGKFTIRCPKCKSLVSVNVSANQKNQNGSAATKRPLEPPPPPAPQYNPPEAAAKNNSQAAGTNEELLQMLAGLFNQNGANGFSRSAKEPERNILLCVPAEQREGIAKQLNENGWKSFVAESPAQAMETLREIKIENVILASGFAPEQRGALVMQNHFFSLMPSERRRIFLIYLDDRAPAGNSHEAFLRNLNLILNSKDLPNLPQILRRERREFDEAYRNYKNALAGV